jgi:hypothetical protein
VWRKGKNQPAYSIEGVLTRDNSSRVDLTAANHVHLMEPHWNPMVEAQALDRIHRIGQLRAVHTIRYVAKDTIEKVRFRIATSLHTTYVLERPLKLMVGFSMYKMFKKASSSLSISLSGTWMPKAMRMEKESWRYEYISLENYGNSLTVAKDITRSSRLTLQHVQ